MGKIRNLNVSDIVGFSINLRTKCVFLVMFRPPLPPCTHLYALVLTPPPPLDAYVINGRPPGEDLMEIFIYDLWLLTLWNKNKIDFCDIQPLVTQPTIILFNIYVLCKHLFFYERNLCVVHMNISHYTCFCLNECNKIFLYFQNIFFTECSLADHQRNSLLERGVTGTSDYLETGH